MKKKAGKDGLVYTTGSSSSNTPEPQQPASKRGGPTEVVLSLEKAGRGGKTVTLVEYRGKLAAEAKELHKELKTKCGAGGKLKGQVGEIQGDQRAYIKELLEQKGFRVRGMV